MIFLLTLNRSNTIIILCQLHPLRRTQVLVRDSTGQVFKWETQCAEVLTFTETAPDWAITNISRKGQPAAGRTRYPVSLDTERKRYRPHGLHCSEQCRACARLARLCSAVVPAASRRAYTSAPPAVNRKRLPNIRKKKINTRTKQGCQS